MSGGRRAIPGTAGIDLGIEGLSEPVLIGQGGFGAVYRAQQLALGRTVAVKILSAPGMNERTRDRFERECVAIGALSGHPHIVTVFDSGINSWGRPFIVMDFMSRGSIADRVALDGEIAWPEATDLGVKICGAVASAHSAGILHRDIKPQNVLVSAYGEPKLGDFGISSIGGEQTSTGNVAASLEHAAPELLEGSRATTATDVYALASTIFTMMSGEPPFARRSDEPIQSLIARIVTESPPDLRPRGIPGASCDVLERALEKNPSARHGSVTDFADALRDVQEQQGLTATPIPQVENVGGFELLERVAPRSTGTTSPTRARIRPEYVPPTPPPAANPIWKRPTAISVGIVLFLLALSASTVALTRTNDRDDPAPRLAAGEGGDDEAAGAEEAGSDERPTAERDAQRRDGKKRNEKRGSRPQAGFSGGGSVAGGSGSSFVPPAGSSSSGTRGGGTAGSNKGGRSGDGKAAPKEKEPAPPPAPDAMLWHAYKDDDHVVGVDPGRRAYYYGRGYQIEEVGRVYDEVEQGTRTLPLDEGAAYGFASGTGETSPQTTRVRLWRISKGAEFFYTTDQGQRARYRGYGWGAGEFGWVAP